MSRLTSASALAVLAVLAACAERNQGVDAVNAGIYFPAAMTLDPRVPEADPARWLFVANANSNLAFNAGSLVAVDLDRFFHAWMNCPQLCLRGIDDGTCTEAAKQNACGVRASVHDVGEPVDEDAPCRHVAFRPQVIECEDTAVLAHVPGSGGAEPLSVRMGSFITALQGWDKDPTETAPQKKSAYLMATVKADPSITWVELSGGLGKPFDPKNPDATTDLDFECGQGSTDLYDAGRCARSGSEAHALRYPFDNPDNPRIGPEPSNIFVSKVRNWAYVTFATTPEVVLIDLAKPIEGALPANRDAATTGATTGDTSGTTTDGGTTTDDGAPTDTTGAMMMPPVVPNSGTRPMIVDARNVFLLGQSGGGGGWGLAERPCYPGSSEVPGVTRVPIEPGGEPVDCARPLVYSSFRTALYFARLVPDGIDAVAGQECLEEEGVEGEPGVIECGAQLFFAGFTSAGGFDNGTGAGQLGDIAFSRDGRRLFALQSNAGALLYVDTSVDERGEIRDEPAGLVELCTGPTRMALFEDGSNEYAAVSCPTPSEVFIVDLSGFRVVANIVTGQGPHPIVVDRARQLLYVGNTLDKTVSVIDIARDRPTRFAEIARVGLQEPYKQ